MMMMSSKNDAEDFKLRTSVIYDVNQRKKNWREVALKSTRGTLQLGATAPLQPFALQDAT